MKLLHQLKLAWSSLRGYRVWIKDDSFLRARGDIPENWVQELESKGWREVKSYDDETA